MKYARQLRREYHSVTWKRLVKQQIWNGNDTKDKIWKVIRSLPEYYFG